jgi:FtsH-binding integral membrane protein
MKPLIITLWICTLLMGCQISPLVTVNSASKIGNVTVSTSTTVRP